jgi:hypothetical protein
VKADTQRNEQLLIRNDTTVRTAKDISAETQKGKIQKLK